MMIVKDTSSGQAIVDAARSMLGTPFHHQARMPGVGLDCIGLLVCAAKAARRRIEDVTAYPRHSTGGDLLRHIAQQLDPVDVAEPGDVLVFWINRRTREPHHVGLATENGGMIHTSMTLRQVVETRIGTWSERLHSAWRLRRA